MTIKLFLKINFLFLFCVLIATSLFPVSVFADSDPVGTSSQTVLTEINKKLDASKKREDQILANQEKIIAEIIKSRKWAFNN